MNMQSKLFFFALLAIAGVFSLYKYNQIVINKNYIIYTNETCNPMVESCFVSDCDLNEADCDRDPYKKIERKAYSTGDCPTQDCSVTLCSEETRGEGEICSLIEIQEPSDAEIVQTEQVEEVVSEPITNN